jgi:hypothetical protein
MDELLQVGDEWDCELTAEEWEKVDELVDKTGCSYYGARWALGLKPPSCQIVHAVDGRLSDQNIPADKKLRPERSRFDTRTQQAHEASGQGPLTEEQKQTNRDGIRMVRTALKNA